MINCVCTVCVTLLPIKITTRTTTILFAFSNFCSWAEYYFNDHQTATLTFTTEYNRHQTARHSEASTPQLESNTRAVELTS